MEKYGVSVEFQIQGLETEIRKIDDLLGGSAMVKLGQAKINGLNEQKQRFLEQIEELRKLNDLNGGTNAD